MLVRGVIMSNFESNSAVKYPVQTLEKALDIISILKVGPYDGVRIKDISEKLSLGKSTVHRILSTLMAYGYVEQSPDNRKYRLGWKLFEVGSVIPRQRNLNNIDLKILWELCERYEETVNFGIRTYDRVAIIAKTDPQRVLFKAGPYLGEHEPLHATALGKVLISDLGEDELNKLFAEKTLGRYTSNTITDLVELKEHLLQVCEQGYAIDNEELSIGLTCIAMPVYNYSNEIIAALSISGPTFRMNFSKITSCKEGLKRSCDQLSTFFGSSSQQ
jgi:IclR family transcriptional regulator, KDG regulon repressor